MANFVDTIRSAVVGIPPDPNKKPSQTGVVQAFIDLQDYTFKQFPDRGSIYFNPPLPAGYNGDLGYSSTPAGGGHFNVVLGAGNLPNKAIADDGAVVGVSRSTLVGSLIGINAVTFDRMSGFGQGVFRNTKFGQRNAALSDLVMQWGGANLSEDASGKFYYHSIIYNQGGVPLVMGNTPGAYVINPLWYNGITKEAAEAANGPGAAYQRNVFGLTQADGEKIVAWMNQNGATGPWATSTEDFAYNFGAARDSLVCFLKGTHNKATGYRTLGLLVEGSSNNADGDNSLFSLLFGNYNDGDGPAALYNKKEGDYTTAKGANAGRSNGKGNYGGYWGAGSGWGSNIHENNRSYLFGRESGLKPDGTTEAVINDQLIFQNDKDRGGLINAHFVDRQVAFNLPIGGTRKGVLHAIAGSAIGGGTQTTLTPGDGGKTLVLEGATDIGISFLSPDAAIQGIYFANSTSTSRGFIQADHTGSGGVGEIRVGYGGNSRFRGNQNGVGFNGNAPSKPALGSSPTNATIAAALISLGLCTT